MRGLRTPEVTTSGVSRASHRPAAPAGARWPPVHYERHRPEQTTLYRLVQQHAASFIADTEASTASELPRFITDEFDAFLECGILAHGLLRLRCGECGHDKRLAFGMENLQARLAEINAPEKGQAFGNSSRQHLAEVCFKKQAVVKPQTTDLYGRTVARVECDGVDANAEQIRAGMAWVFDKYVTDRSLYALPDEARTARRGLWAESHPMPPWEWRRSARTK